MNPQQSINKPPTVQSNISRMNREPLIFKKSSPSKNLLFPDPYILSKDDRKNFQPKQADSYYQPKINIGQSNISGITNINYTNNLGHYPSNQVHKNESNSNSIFDNAFSQYQFTTQTTNDINLKNNIKGDEVQSKKEELLKKELDSTLKLLDQSNRHKEQLNNKLKAKDIKIQQLEEEVNRLKSKLHSAKKKINANRITGGPRYVPNKVGFNIGSIEETKNQDTDENEIKSIQLALRLEAEDMIFAGLNEFNHVENFESFPSNRTIDLANPQRINPDSMTYEQLLQLEEKIGCVNKGLKKEDIKKIPKTIYTNILNSSEDK